MFIFNNVILFIKTARVEKKYTWFKIAGEEKEIVFQSNNMAIVMVNGKVISLGRHEDRLYAFAHQCPHAGGIMADGWIDIRGNVVCPVHGYRFNMLNGRNVTGEGYSLKHWLVERRQDGVYVAMEE